VASENTATDRNPTTIAAALRRNRRESVSLAVDVAFDI
jgi:hypothetical protein